MIRHTVVATFVGFALLAACTDDGVDSTADSTSTTEPPVKRTTTTTTTTTTSSTTTSSSGTEGSQSSRRAVVTADGGRIEVTGDDGVLVVVDVQTNDGWNVDLEPSGDDRLLATFTADGRRTEVTIVLTEDGISSSTRSTSSD